MGDRKIEKKDNFFSMQIREGEEVTISIKSANGQDEAVVFIVPFDAYLNCYMKRETLPIMWKEN